MSAAVGADIESLCNKCGDVWHVVVAKVGDSIAKVQCKECGGYHRYRPPRDSRAKSSVQRRRTASSHTAKKQPAVRIDRPAVEADTSKPVRPYRYSESYQAGDRIEHPKFGHGVVEICSEPGKMQVFFPEGRRILALAKPKPSLERPGPFRHDD
ncbi:MAG: hypothetical protein MJE77_42560 [Proteobacteria bacterium]|nr:hypothetical protein [Pseudomonadota bacterium]